MAYTVAIKRRWLWARKVRVTGHDWQNFRLILNREDGKQEHIPGFLMAGYVVYDDIWAHQRQREFAGQAYAQPAPRPVAHVEEYRQGATAAPIPVQQEPIPERVYTPDPLFEKATQLAKQRVESILASDRQPPGAQPQ